MSCRCAFAQLLALALNVRGGEIATLTKWGRRIDRDTTLMTWRSDATAQTRESVQPVPDRVKAEAWGRGVGKMDACCSVC